MRALKSLVVGLGILIVVAMGAMAWGLYHKASDPDFRLFADGPAEDASATMPTTPAAAMPARPFGDVIVPIPAGCTIAEMRPQGGRLYLRLGPAGPCARIIVVDTTSGTVLGTVRTTP